MTERAPSGISTTICFSLVRLDARIARSRVKIDETKTPVATFASPSLSRQSLVERGRHGRDINVTSVHLGD